jgi:hypothetical protein
MKDRTLDILFAVGIIIAVTTAIAAAALVPASGDVSVETNSGLIVEFQDVSQFESDPFVDDQTIRTTNGTIASAGTSRVETAGTDIGGSQRFNLTDQTTAVTVNKDDANAITVSGSVDDVTIDAGTAADDGNRDFQYSASGPGNITVDGLSANTQFILVDAAGQGVATATSDGSGTVTFVNVEEGRVDARITTFILEIREIAPDVPIIQGANSSVTLRLFEEGTDRVFTRNVTNGQVNLNQFPDETRFTVTANTEGFETRRTFIESARNQQDIFLLNSTAPTSTVIFRLDDRTGDFAGQDGTSLIVERALDTTDSEPGEEQYQNVAGDIIGSQLLFEGVFERGIRYRVSVSNDDGQTRQLGAFLIDGDRQIDLVISGIDQGVDRPQNASSANAVVDTTLEENNGTKDVAFFLTDFSGETTSVDVRVEEQGNSSNVFALGSDTDPTEFKFSRSINTTKPLVANYSYVRDGTTVSGTIPFGQQQFPLLTQLDPGWAQIFGVGFLLMFGGIFSRANARVGALVIPGLGLLLFITGILDGTITVIGVGVAFALAVGINILSGGGIGGR